jgi:uncharacterized damage-inducible protein DinB
MISEKRSIADKGMQAAEVATQDQKKMFIDAWEREFQTTLKVLKAFPEERQDMKPHEKSKSALQLAWVFPSEENAFIPGVVSGKIDFGKGPAMPKTMKEVISEYEKAHKKMVEFMKKTDASNFEGTMKFYVGPKKEADIPKWGILWMTVMDQIHHRGQFSVYLRMAGGKVPSIYGPTADEPWN